MATELTNPADRSRAEDQPAKKATEPTDENVRRGYGIDCSCRHERVTAEPAKMLAYNYSEMF